MLNEKTLLDGELVVEGRLVDASNATLYGKIITSIGKEIAVVYKPIAGERILWDFADGNLASREVAAYCLSQSGGFNCVPFTVMRDGPFGAGAVQEWIELQEEYDPIEIGQSSSPAIRNLALFDVVINNTDRKFGHILPISQDRVLGCDHGLTFHQDFKLRTVIWQFAGEALTKEESHQITLLKTWIESQGRALLKELITEDEIAALLLRIEQLLSGGYPYPPTDWPAVPWPPV